MENKVKLCRYHYEIAKKFKDITIDKPSRITGNETCEICGTNKFN